MMRRINRTRRLAAPLAGRFSLNGVFLTVLGAGSTALAGSFSTGASNTNPGATDPAIPGFVGGGVVNPAFVGWASQVVSYQPAPDVGEDWNLSAKALGPVTGNNFDIVSLGDLDSQQIASGALPGRITLSFNRGIRNSTGPDFAVFENGLFNDAVPGQMFAELAYVEVSSDGQNFARFPSTSLTAAQVGPYGTINPTDVHNLAGKHVNSWGTPFDLSDLAANPLVGSGSLNLHAVKFVRIVDIPGDGTFRDSANRSIYDAWITFGSGGFDLEAIGVLNPWLGGDANLDGVVDVFDLNVLASHWQQSASEFTQGDFDRNGFVNAADLWLLAGNWQGGSPQLLAAVTSLGLPVSSVPEPSGFVLLFASLFLKRIRKSSI